MALHFCSLSVKILTLFVIILLFLPRAVTAIPELELESMLAVVRTRGYNLFCNAITTSDIYYEVLAGTSFTFFAPTDASLFALDMTATSSDYITTLRYHVVPRRFSLSDLRTLPPGSSLHTLVPLHDIRIERLPSLGYDIITANGIDVVVPGLFYGRDIAVHGLGGIFSFRSQIGQRQDSPPPPSEVNFSGNHSSVVGDSHAPPPENSSSFDRFAQRQDSPPPPSEANFFGNHSSVVGDSDAPPPENSSSFDRFAPPISEGMDNITVVSPEPGVANVDGFSPANPPVTGGFHHDISPAYGLWPGISTSPALAPKTQPPVPSVPEDDNPAAPSPSFSDRFADHGGDSDPMMEDLTLSERYEASIADGSNDMEESKTTSSGPGELPVTTPSLRKELVAGITTIAPEIPSPYDSDTFDCPVRRSNRMEPRQLPTC